jgi:hypothetical protein
MILTLSARLTFGWVYLDKEDIIRVNPCGCVFLANHTFNVSHVFLSLLNLIWDKSTGTHSGTVSALVYVVSPPFFLKAGHCSAVIFYVPGFHEL